MIGPTRHTLGLAVCLWLLTAGRAAAADSSPCLALPVVQHSPATAPASRAPTGSIVVASLNMAGRPGMGDAIAAWVADRAIDVLLLQEVGPSIAEGESFAVGMSDRLGYQVAYVPAYSPEEYNQGLAILSRYPLSGVEARYLPFHRLRINWRCRNALAVSVATTAGMVRVVDLHLDTRINSGDRVAQVDSVLADLRGTVEPQIVGGDFNSMNVGWIGSVVPVPYAQRQPAAVRRALGLQGFVTPFGETRPTFKLLGLPLKLDWLYLKHANATAWSVDDVPGSDHRGIWTSLTLGRDSLALNTGQAGTMSAGTAPVGAVPVGDLPVGDLPVGDLSVGDLSVGDVSVGSQTAGSVRAADVSISSVASTP